MRGSYLEKTKPSKGRKIHNRKINSKQYVSDTRCNSRVSFFSPSVVEGEMRKVG